MKLIFYDLFVLVTFLSLTSTENSKRIVCYYTNWSVYRHAIVPVLYPDSIDPKLCTHIHLAFARVDPITFEIQPSENHDIHYTSVFSTPLYTRLSSLKKLRPSIKLLIAVGGWTAGSEAFNNILTNSTTRSIFINQTKQFLTKWNFDGIDLDWEYPGDRDRGAKNNSREEFNLLLKEMHESFRNQSKSFLLTAAVSASPTKIDQGYIIPDLCRHLDYISVMTYDYHGSWDNVTGINAPLYGRTLRGMNGFVKGWSVNDSIHHWLKHSCSPSKINLGLALYGRSFTLMNNSNSINIGTKAIGGGLAGPYTKESGTLAYFEICQKLRVHNWTSVFDTDAQAPYAYSLPKNSTSQQWVGYDNLESVAVKVSYAKLLKLGGVMLWSLDQDDYTGLFCDHGEFPFTRRVYDILQSQMNLTHQSTIKTVTISTNKIQSSTKWNEINRSAHMTCSLYFVFLVFFCYLLTQ